MVRKKSEGLSVLYLGPQSFPLGCWSLGETQHGNVKQPTFPGTAWGPTASLSGFELVNLAGFTALNTKQTGGTTASEPVLDK